MLMVRFPNLAATVLIEQCEINQTIVTTGAEAVRKMKCMSQNKITYVVHNQLR